MTFIRNYIILVVGCIFLSTFVQTALPDSTLKKTLRFVLGLILGVIIITPFARFGGDTVQFSWNASPTAPPLSAQQQQQMETLMQQQTHTLFRQTLEQTILRTIVEHGGAETTGVLVDCNVNGEIHSITIVSQDRTLPTLISQTFDIPLQKIHLRAETPE